MHIKNKLISTTSFKSSQFDPHSHIKSILVPRHKTQLVLIRTPNKSFSTATQRTNQCRSTTLKWSNLRQPSQQPNALHPTLESSEIRSLSLKSRYSWPPTQNGSQFARSYEKQLSFAVRSKTKSISTTHTTTKLISSRQWNEVKFDRPHWNQVISDHPHKNKFKFHPHPKS